MPYILSEFGSTPIPQYNGRHDLSTAAATARGVPVATGGEFDLYGDDRARADAMTISINGWLIGDDVDTAFRALRARARAKDVLWRLWDDGTREWTPARLLQVPAETPRGIRGVNPSLVFWLPMPLWYAETPITTILEDLYDEGESDLPTLGAEGTTVGDPVLFTVVNTGNLPSTRVRFTITSGTGTITAVSIENETTGHEITWTGSLTTGQVLIIDAGIERVTKNGTALYTGLVEPSDKERWFELAPGTNSISVDLTDSATDDTSTVALAADPTSA